ncbi:MAG: hypothetical protein LBC02_14220 [Planctomycetaceae bacterium]|nr:hypothetical protein [Planctomycetaceae bacterium]
MTSPILPHVPDEGTTESRALSPSMKIFAATTIIIGGAAVAAAFWKASLDFGVIDSGIHSAIDRSFAAAPLPNFPLQPNAVSTQPEKSTANDFGNTNQESAFSVQSAQSAATMLPALSQTPAVDSGNKKYAQKYQPPIIEPAPQTSEKIFAAEKKIDSEKPVTPSNTRFEPIHKISVPPATAPTATVPSVTAPVTNNNQTANNFAAKIEKKPPAVPKTETNDEMRSLFQFADNFEQSSFSKVESALPENPFVTDSSLSETEPNLHSAVNLLPLHSLESPQSKESLLPLKPTETPFSRLQPLKTISNREPKI